MDYERIASYILGSLFIGLLLLTIGYRYYDAQQSSDVIIVQDINRLATIFNHIHETCHILSFEHDKNYVDFLHVRSFTGSEIGLMNIAYPERWEGPYVNDNPTMQEKYYMIVRTKQGYYLVPGDGGAYCISDAQGGVQLANGKVIGKDIIFTQESDIEAMMRDPEMLLSKNGAFAARISVGNDG